MPRSKLNDRVLQQQNMAAVEAFGIPASCFDSGSALTPSFVQGLSDTFGNDLGGACFPSVNMNPWADSSGKSLTGALFGGEAQSDGTPDGNLNPKREYQAVEIEVNKAMSHNWSLIANWRIARLRGNFEGAFRNDNGQNDPGISSLYDFTPGELNTIGFQLIPGPLNADRLHIVNVYPTYIFDKGPLRGLVVTPGVRIQSGVPLTTLVAQEDYGNFGEVPLHGRGDLGRAPVTGTVDVHLDYPRRITESKVLHFSIDMLNIANTKRNLSINQYPDVDFGVLNADFMKPGAGAASWHSAEPSARIRCAVQRSFPRELHLLTNPTELFGLPEGGAVSRPFAFPSRLPQRRCVCGAGVAGKSGWRRNPQARAEQSLLRQRHTTPKT